VLFKAQKDDQLEIESKTENDSNSTKR